MDGLTELEQLKALLVVLTFGVAVAGLLLPSYGGLGARTNVALNLGAGGVVLSSAVVHLLPDAAEADGDFPWAFALFGFGYLSTLSLDAFGGGHGHGASPEGGSPKYESVPSLEGGAAARSKAAARSAAAATASATTALAVHSLGDGAAIGVQVHARACAVVGLAIVVHKFFGALALGAILSRDGPLLKAPAAIFAVATPVALLASWAGAREGLFGGVFADRATALCAGTLLHVCIHEIIGGNLRRPELRGPAKLAYVWGGFSAMTLLAVWV